MVFIFLAYFTLYNGLQFKSFSKGVKPLVSRSFSVQVCCAFLFAIQIYEIYIYEKMHKRVSLTPDIALWFSSAG